MLGLVVVLKYFIILLPMLLAVAFITLAERKVMGAAHRRLGPNVVGWGGLLQPVFDGVKLLLKESILPETSGKLLFILAPMLVFFLSIIGWMVMPFDEVAVVSDIWLGVFYLFAISTLGVYAVLLAGWSSNSRYALLGGLRSAAQMVSYEVAFGVIVLSVIVCVGSLNIVSVVAFQRYVWLAVPLLPMFVLFFLSTVAETNRAPFDLPEAETELVSGYNIEYSAVGFALFFMGEYGNILLMSMLTVLLFLGGWQIPFFPSFLAATLCIKLMFVIFMFVWIRVSFPRFRYDQLMRLGWKVFLPIALGWLLLISGTLLSLDWLPTLG